MSSLERLSLNQKTTNSWSLREAIDGCVAAGIGDANGPDGVPAKAAHGDEQPLTKDG